MTLSTADRLEILELAARYNFAVDALDAEARADLFTPDGVFLAGTAVRAAGRQALIEYVRQLATRKVRLRHWTGNHVIDGEEGAARLRCYVMVFDLGKGLCAPYVMGSYDDTLLRQDGRWKFSTRRLQICAGQSQGPV